MTFTTTPPASTAPPRELPEIQRYTLSDRIVHWEVGVTFVYLLLTGIALAYPRLAWLQTMLGG